MRMQIRFAAYRGDLSVSRDADQSHNKTVLCLEYKGQSKEKNDDEEIAHCSRR